MHTSSDDFVTAVNLTLPESLRDGVLLWLERLGDAGHAADLPESAIPTLLKVVAGSEFAAGVLLNEWHWFVESLPTIDDIPDAKELDQLVAQIRQSDAEQGVVQQQLRRERHRFMLHVLWRDAAGLAAPGESIVSLSTLADRLLDAAAGFAERKVRERFGSIRNDAGEAMSLVILGMGKLGGSELNFSSDIDLITLYPAGGDSDGPKSLSAPEYYTRVVRHIVALLDEVTADGFAFRIDTRLRPFGDSGPPVVSFAALEAYLLQHGRDWERYAYVKARIVGQQPNDVIAAELQQELIGPFVYRRYLDFGVFESLREMHGMIAAEVARREMADNIKLGPGGIREIEFIVQSLQLVRGGANPELQSRSLLHVLPALVGRHGLDADEASKLEDAYHFLRRLENFIQAIRDQQTHDLPTDSTDQDRLCLLMACPTWDELLSKLNQHRHFVTRQFEAVAFRERSVATDDQLQQRLSSVWERRADAAGWADVLAREGYESATALADLLTAFSSAPGTQHIGAAARRRLHVFMPTLLRIVRESTDPLMAVKRVLALVEKILRRSAYIALLNENEKVLRRLVELCERSAYIADQIARYPVLLDELLDPDTYANRMSREQLVDELADRLASSSVGDSEEHMAVLGQFQRANLFRIAVADFSDKLPIMKVSDSLTELAETVLQDTLRVVWSDMITRHGVPAYVAAGKRHEAGFAIIAYGKLGGLEMSYGSDLDLVYLHDSRGDEQMTNGEKPIANSVFFIRLVRRLSHFLTTQTGSGMLYEVDTRLRPDGQSGVMVSSVDAFERYQEENAWTWEHQALLRARPVAGSDKIAQEFDRIRAETLSARVRRDKLLEDVPSMRRRMRASLDQSDADRFDLKQGIGGIADIEFLVQYLVLKNAATDVSVFYYSDNIRQLDALAAVNAIDVDESERLQEIYKDYRLRSHHLVLDEQNSHVAQSAFVVEREYVQLLWKKYFGRVVE